MPLIILINVISKKKKNEQVFLILLFLLCAIAGNKHIENKLQVLNEYDCIEQGEIASIVGKVNNIWESKNGLSVEIKILKDGSKAVCYFTTFDYEIGKIVTITGEKKSINKSTNPGEFDLKQYYNSKKVFLILQNCRVVKSGEEYSEIFHGFYLARQRLKEAILNICDNEEAGVICAMLFGDKEYLDGEIKDLYTMSGIGHILAISGVCTLSLVSLRPP